MKFLALFSGVVASCCHMASVEVKVTKSLCFVVIAVVDLEMLLFYMVICKEKPRPWSIALGYFFCYCFMNC